MFQKLFTSQKSGTVKKTVMVPVLRFVGYKNSGDNAHPITVQSKVTPRPKHRQAADRKLVGFVLNVNALADDRRPGKVVRARRLRGNTEQAKANPASEIHLPRPTAVSRPPTASKAGY